MKGNCIKKEMQDARKKLKKATEELKSDLDVIESILILKAKLRN